MAEQFTAEELLDMLDSCDGSGSNESDFEDDRMFSYLGTSTGVVVAPLDSEESTSMVALEGEHSQQCWKIRWTVSAMGFLKVAYPVS